MPVHQISPSGSDTLGRPSLHILAIDHRTQFDQIAQRCGVGTKGLPAFKRLAVAAAATVATRRPGVGIIADSAPYGAAALTDAAAAGLWTARPIEQAGTQPIRFVIGPDITAGLMTWPKEQVIKCLCHYDPHDPADLRAEQDASLVALHDAVRGLGRTLLLEIIPRPDHPDRGAATAEVIEHLYSIGLCPAWWKLEPHLGDTTWERIGDAIARHDPTCQGVLILGLTTALVDLAHDLAGLARHPVIRGFAVGRAIHADILARWLTGTTADLQARDEMADRFEALIDAWATARNQHLPVVP